MEYRLNKFISSSGVCSRREADRFIATGNVIVDGSRATMGQRVLPGQKVKVNGVLVERDIEPTYIAFNKPVGIVCTTDQTDKDNIVDYVGHEQRVFPIGRIDKESQGLILLTNDGDIVNKILRAENRHSKEYIVTVDRPITDDFIESMTSSVPILGRMTRKCEIVKLGPYVFQIILTQGLNRQIRRMCEHFNYFVTKLERVQIMHIKLGKLAQGEWRNLTTDELQLLFDSIEKSSARESANNKPKRSSYKKFRAPSDGEHFSESPRGGKATRADRSESFGDAPSRGGASKSAGARHSSGKPVGGRPSTGRPTSGRPTTGRPSTGRPTSAPHSAGGRPSTGRPTGAPHSAGGRPSTGRPSTGRPSTGRPTSAPYSAGGRHASGKPVGGRPTGAPKAASGRPTSAPKKKKSTGSSSKYVSKRVAAK